MKSVWRDASGSRTVTLDALGPGRWRVDVDGAVFELAAESLPDGRLRLTGGDGPVLAEVTAAGTRRFVRLGALEFVLDRETVARGRGAGAHGGGLEAPMPGVVTKVLVAPGDAVTKGQPLVAIEAMKMEHLVRAPRDGRVAAVPVAAGAMVAAGTRLVELAD